MDNDTKLGLAVAAMLSLIASCILLFSFDWRLCVAYGFYSIYKAISSKLEDPK